MSKTEPIVPARSTQPFPAPVAFLVALLVSAGIQRVAPWPTLAGAWRWVIAIALNAGGIGLGLATLSVMRRAGVSPDPRHPAPKLVTDGPFRWSRNPMYVSMVLNYLGIGALFAPGWSLALLPLVIVSVHLRVVRAEERSLAAAFGDAYVAYKQRVRAWL